MPDEYATMIYAADAAIFTPAAPSVMGIVLIQRGDDSDAFAGAWALPGGMVEPDETAHSAIVREVEEETKIALSFGWYDFLGVYDTPRRDPRGRVVSSAFTAWAADPLTPVGSDDAKHAEVVPLHQIFERPLAFDHKQIITDALNRYGYGYLAR